MSGEEFLAFLLAVDVTLNILVLALLARWVDR